MMYYLSFVYQLIEFFLVQYLLILILSLWRWLRRRRADQPHKTTVSLL
jgi:hypothetical protein